MNGLKIFEHPDFGEVRTLETNGVILFSGSDVAKALGYSRPADAVSAHCKGSVIHRLPTAGGTQDVKFIPESDLYRLVFRSKLPTAEKFTDWVTMEVLPSIRKHGAYMTDETIEQVLSDPDTIIRLATQLKEERSKNKVLAQRNTELLVDKQIMQPKADYFDELVERNLLTNFRETAKLFDIKEKVFIRFLLDKKYIYRDQKGHLMPYMEKGRDLFEVKESANNKTGWTGTQTLVTPKGRETFRLLCKGLA